MIEEVIPVSATISRVLIDVVNEISVLMILFARFSGLHLVVFLLAPT